MPKAYVHSIDKEVGQRLRIRRKRIGLSQAKLGAMLGISSQQIQKYEDGVNRVSLSRLVFVAEALNVPLTYFIEGLMRSNANGNGAGNSHDAGVFVTDPLAMELCRIYLGLRDQKLRKLMLEIVRRLSRAEETTAI